MKPSWDEYFLSMAYFVALKSKDESTKIGSIIVGKDNEVVGTGFNGLPRGVKESSGRNIKPYPKYFFFEHGERNAIYSCARVGSHTKGCRMYTMGVPCADCARAVIQAGLEEVLVHYEWNEKNGEKWRESAEYSKQMFEEAGVKLTYLKNPNLITKIVGLNDGCVFELNSK